MGVLGLWQLLNSTGRPLTLESLENKTLAVDISLWMNQAVRGVRDRRGITVENAHLLVLFNRICKLLHYRIKPIFVFDGPAPALKQRLLERRRNLRMTAQAKAQKLTKKWLENAAQQHAVNKALAGTRSPSKSPIKKGEHKRVSQIHVATEPIASTSTDMFALPPPPTEGTEEDRLSGIFDESTDEDSDDEYSGPSSSRLDFENLDINSKDFKALPPDIRHELLLEMQQARKRPSWNSSNRLPAESDTFSQFQIGRLLTRSQVQVALDKTAREMNSRRTGTICGQLAEETAVTSGIEFHLDARRIASEDASHYLLLKKKPKVTKAEVKGASTGDKDVDDKVDELPQSPVSQPSTSSALPDVVLRILEKKIEAKKAPCLPDLFEDHDEDVVITGQNFKCFRNPNTHLIKAEEEDTDIQILSPRTPPTRKLRPRKTVTAIEELEVETTGSSDITANVHREQKSEELTEAYVPWGSTTPRKPTNEKPSKPLSTGADAVYVNGRKSQKSGIHDFVADNIGNTPASTPSNPNMNVVTLPAVAALGMPISPRKSSSFENKNNNDSIGTPASSEDRSRKPGFLRKPSGLALISVSEPPVVTVDSSDSDSEFVEVPEQIFLPATPPSATVLETSRLSTIIESPNVPLSKEISDPPDFFAVDADLNDSIVFSPLSSEPDVPARTKALHGTHSDPVQESIVDLDKSGLDDELDEEMIDMIHNSQESMPSTQSTVDLDRAGLDDELDQDLIDMIFATPDLSGKGSETAVDPLQATDATNHIEDVEDQPEISVEELESLHEHLATQGKSLRNEQKREERIAASVTDQLQNECQELLRLFGIPYIDSPGEAEAQCAHLDLTKVTHGTVTDDSDVWLFGGQKVYKHVFHQKRFVEYYNTADIEKQLGLARDKMIALALLTGSDYTEGIEGVGGVRALEILAEFGGYGTDSLRKFRSWWTSVQKRKSGGDIRPENKLRGVLMNLDLPESFPDQVVVNAYLQPDVDESKEKFTWGVPALDLLRDYTRKKFGWKQSKADETLLPIIKKMNMKETQTRLESFFSIQLKVTKPVVHSRRLGTALQKLKSSEDLDAEPGSGTSKATGKRAGKTVESKKVENGGKTVAKKSTRSNSKSSESAENPNTEPVAGSSVVRRTRKKKVQEETSDDEVAPKKCRKRKSETTENESGYFEDGASEPPKRRKVVMRKDKQKTT